DAEQISAGVFRHTDKSGKVWIYRKTPFGLSKFEEGAAQEKAAAPVVEDSNKNASGKRDTPFGEVRSRRKEQAAASQPAITETVDNGDTVQFERSSPFGTYRWTRKKA